MPNFSTNNPTAYARAARPRKPNYLKFKPLQVGVVLVTLLILGNILSEHGSQHALAAKPVMPSQSVCLDPGHGGDDPGAINGNLTEAATNLTVAKKVRSVLLKKGYGVYMTRTSDVTLSNADRVNFCNAKNTTILVSIHQNAFTDNGPDYSTALFYKPQDIELANTLANSAGLELGLTVTPPMAFDDGMLERAHMPSAIIESYFITNDTEATAMINGYARIDQQAFGIEKGIELYLQAHKPTTAKRSLKTAS